MAAGDLENIFMTAPDSTTMHSSRVRNIYWRDHNNVNRSVKYVYWCPDGVTAKLVWQRDHTPVTTSYTTLKENGSTLDRAYAFKYTATSSPITQIDIWTYSDLQTYNMRVAIYDENFNRVFSTGSPTFSELVSILNVEGTDQNVKQLRFTNLNVSLTSGNTYYIFASTLYHNNNYFMPYVKTTGTANYEYALFRVADDVIESSSSFTSVQYRIITGTQPKIEINGAQI